MPASADVLGRGEPPAAILLVRTDRIGDLLTSTPLIRELRNAYPQARIDLVASDLNLPVAAANPHVDRVWVLPKKNHLRWPAILARVRMGRYDWAVDLIPSYSRTSGWLVRFSGAATRVCFAKERAGAFCNVFVPQGPEPHMVLRQLTLARALGAEGADPQMVFCVSEESRSWARRTWPRVSGRTRVALFIGNAKKVQTRWPEDNFGALADELLADPSVEVLVLAGPSDRALLRAFGGKWRDRCVMSPARSLGEDAALLEICDLLVTSSSGPMHLAAAVGTPTLSILTDYTYACWRPLGGAHRVVRSGRGGVDVRGVSVNEVLSAVRTLLAEIQPRRSADPVPGCGPGADR